MSEHIEIASIDGTGGTVYVLHISHRCGDNITLHATAELAEKAKADFAHTYWHEVAGKDGRPVEPPKDDAELVRLYFTGHPDGDCASIHVTGVEGERAGSGTQPYTVADAFTGIPGALRQRSLMIEGITTEAMWRDLERALNLPRYGLGRWKEWAAGQPKLLTDRYDLDVAARWAQQNGLPYEDERAIRYDPAAKPDERALSEGGRLFPVSYESEDASGREGVVTYWLPFVDEQGQRTLLEAQTWNGRESDASDLALRTSWRYPDNTTWVGPRLQPTSN